MVKASIAILIATTTSALAASGNAGSGRADLKGSALVQSVRLVHKWSNVLESGNPGVIGLTSFFLANWLEAFKSTCYFASDGGSNGCNLYRLILAS